MDNVWAFQLARKHDRSVVVACLDLLDILVRCPDHPERNEKINDIQTIIINMHHLINKYCPLQKWLCYLNNLGFRGDVLQLKLVLQ
ncbi:hypothetical protein TELCIR_12259, partial [Teladorsagia circumcincta]